MKSFLVTLAVELLAVVLAYHYTKRFLSKLLGKGRERFRRRMENPRAVFKAEKDVYFNREYARPPENLKKAG